ncbi:MAG: hypothetical protein U1F83_04460 [Verrucomicrobiota bacterium]
MRNTNTKLRLLAHAALAGWGIASNCPLFAQTTNQPAIPTLEPVIVTGQRPSVHDVESESERVGPANQPEWTTRRVFAETDVYVIPPGEIEFNQFYISSHPREGKAGNLFESEFEFGLPWRTQFDLETNYRMQNGSLQYDSTLVELPHALADWGKIPLNPTINGGWIFKNDDADSYFVGLLLADEFGERLHFGANLSYGHQIASDHETVYELNAALNYVVIDSKLSVGGEFLVEYETEEEENGSVVEKDYTTTVMLGPSVLYRPTRNTFVGLTSFFGLTHDSPIAEVFINFGVDWEPFAGKSSASNEDQVRPIRRYR